MGNLFTLKNTCFKYLMNVKKKTLQQIVKDKFPGVKIVPATDAPTSRDFHGIRSVAGLGKMKAKLSLGQSSLGSADSVTGTFVVAAPKKISAGKSGPSGMVMIAPKNSDAYNRRQNSKAVIVSHGKVIAVQG